MHQISGVTKDVIWVGANDRRLKLFENIFPIANGVSFNSYLVRDEKNVLFDTVDKSSGGQFLENVAYALNGGTLDYLVVLHVEPDHAALIPEIIRRYPNVKVVGNARTFTILKQFFGDGYGLDADGRAVTVGDGESFTTGKHTFKFIYAPMVHWPEVMTAYDTTDKILFSADAFGSFGALSGNIFADCYDFEREFADETRRYYTNIVGKYGPQVAALIKKAGDLDIKYICPLHGPVWRKNLSRIIDRYKLWAECRPEEKSVLIVYGSVYGGTENAANVFAGALSALTSGKLRIRVFDVSATDVSVLVSEAFRAEYLVLACSTYNAGLYRGMEVFLEDLKAHAFKNRRVALIENGSWALSAANRMKAILADMKTISVTEPTVSFRSALTAQDAQKLFEAAAALIADTDN
ncbi:MAG: FprA family A-type flavoprotein [Clostridiaceae bacterium]|jgi:flavorubredoxin|nr:FprA family A-type flavoprotein [Clostridiaceae bacterium]